MIYKWSANTFYRLAGQQKYNSQEKALRHRQPKILSYSEVLHIIKLTLKCFISLTELQQYYIKCKSCTQIVYEGVVCREV